MCRLLGVVTRTPSTLLHAVPDELPLFTALSEEHKDGWGVAWYGQPRPVGADASRDLHNARDLHSECADPASGLEVRRGTDVAHASNAYGDAVAEARGDIEIVHLRRASEGLIVSIENSHPFTQGPVAFAHNGVFHVPSAFRERVLARGARPPHGSTDSELYFSLILAHAREHDWARAIQLAALDVTNWLDEFGAPYPEGLNCLVMTPEALYAYAQSDPDQLKPTSNWRTYDLMYRVESQRVVVTSTGYEQPDYATLGQGEALTIHRGALEVERRDALDGFRVAPVRLEGEAAWAAKRPDAPGAQASLAAERLAS